MAIFKNKYIHLRSINNLKLLKMAKIKFGMMMTDARGKLGGQVFSKNRAGAYIRTKVTPTNPQSTAQVQARTRLAGNSSAWSELSEAKRTAWNSAVESYQKTDIFGDLKKPSGKNLFTGLNANLQMIGEATISEPKSPVALIDPLLLSITSLDGGEFVLANLPEVTNQVYVVQATPNLSAGTTNFSGKFFNIAYFQGGSGSYDIHAEYNAKFGGRTVGKKIAIRVFVVNITTGQSSVGIKASAIVS